MAQTLDASHDTPHKTHKHTPSNVWMPYFGLKIEEALA